MAISTSNDPFLAGQPSDVIVGGGMNLRVLEAIKVEVEKKQDGYCVSGKRSYEWLPEQVSTFVLTVYEIEKTMERLGFLIRNNPEGDPKNQGGHEQALKNWQTVLSDYRTRTLDSTATLVDGIAAELQGFEATFDSFTQKTDKGDALFKKYLASGLYDLDDAGRANRERNNDVQEIRRRQRNVDKISRTMGANNIGGYTKRMGQLIEQTKANCAAGNQFGLGQLCDGNDKLIKQTKAAAEKLLGVCSFGREEDRPAVVQKFCQEGSGPGDVTGRTAFDALSHSDRLVTFAGTVAVEMEYTIGKASARTTDVGFSTDRSKSQSFSQSACADIFRRRLMDFVQGDADTAGDRPGRLLAEDKADAPDFCRRLSEELEIEEPRRRRRLGAEANLEFSQTRGKTLQVELSRASSREDEQSHSISITLADPSPYDFFAVKIGQVRR
ncbi:hypothetical protein M885DRAFT_78637 [Pelagophyceae sp. CCMP2097]|nr:hypothetical protein M885DRAFT_78637 [Pelagophyceae sp. CCMP2097]